MSTSTSAVMEFLADTGLSEPISPPEPVMLPLRQRFRLIETGELDPTEWHAVADAWSRRADARYRACTTLRSPTSDAPVVRIGIKDTVDVAGFPTTLGLRNHRHHPATSATVVRRLRNAVVTAKVVATELNIGIGSGCGNPYFPRINPAGSSTGSGVAVAAGICDISLGTDVLGSVRWPAGRCGVVGLRTTHNPNILQGVFPLCPAMDAPGWVARTADDLAFLWGRVGIGVAASTATSGPLRIGVPQEVLDGCIEPKIADAVEITVRALAYAGHEVTRVRLGDLWNWRGPAWELCARDAWNGFQVWRERISDDLLESTMVALETGARISDQRYAEIFAALLRLRSEAVDVFKAQRVDAWLLPLDAVVPRPREEKPVAASTIPTPDDPAYDRKIGYTPIASFAGLPAITFPVGRTRHAPLAVQLVGPPHTETTLIQLARDAGEVLGEMRFAPR
ncbi:amidase [Nocardia sp. NPDC052566]|uniref:amidase n=1 Tax=Nocardia sp. NPDC052566 TaxID=3364330 RepID=UPI0037CACBC7